MFKADFRPDGIKYEVQKIERRWVLLPPVVYRYMDKQYIEEFFDTGRLMLSSFSKFRAHADEQRGDEQEGMNLIVGAGCDKVVSAQVEVGRNSYVLCTSVHGNDELMHQFKTNGYFRITDTHYFGRAIADALNGCTDGLEGFCTYKDEHVIRKQMLPSVSLKFDLNNNIPIDMEKAAEAAIGLAGAEAFFSKRRAYENQTEYRIIWNMDHDVEGSVVIECPDALKFCEKIGK